MINNDKINVQYSVVTISIISVKPLKSGPLICVFLS